MTVTSPRWPSTCTGCGRDSEIESRPTHGMRALCDACAAKPYTLAPAPALEAPNATSNGTVPNGTADVPPPAAVLKPRGIDMARVQPFKWAWRDRVLIGYLNLLVGDEGVGKGTLLSWLIARLTRGDLEGDLYGKPARVLIVGDEDGFDNVWVPRLYAADADLTRVCDLPVDESGALDIGRDAKKLRALLLADRFDVVIFDQLLDNLGADVDDWRAKSVRGAIAPLRRLAADLNITPIAALHTNKSDATTFRRRLAGTQAFNALSRSSLLLAAHPDDPDKRVVLRGKGNYAAPPKAIEFRIQADPVTLNGHTHKPTIAADVQDSDVTIEDILGAVPEPQTKAHAARTLIAEALEDGDWHDATPIRTELAHSGLSARGIVRAANDIGVERRRTDGFPSSAQWRLARGGGTTVTTGTTGTTAIRSSATHASRASDDAPKTLTRLDDEHALIDRIAAAFDATEIDPAQARLADITRAAA